MKGEKGTITTQIKGNGPIGNVVAVADNKGNVKGYVSNSQLELPLNEKNGKINVGAAVGNEGMIYIIKDIGLKEPYVGMSKIVSGEIAEDFTNYFATSEQVPTVIALGVSFNENNEVKSSGGFFADDNDDDIVEMGEGEFVNDEDEGRKYLRYEGMGVQLIATQHKDGSMHVTAEDRDGNELPDYPLPPNADHQNFSINEKLGTATDDCYRKYVFRKDYE